MITSCGAIYQAGSLALLERNTTQARQALRKILQDRVDVVPFEKDGRRGVRFTAKCSFGRILAGEALPLMVVPPG